MNVLFAEDNALYRRAIKSMLHDWGYHVEVATNGREAWELAQKPDSSALVLLDWQMPELDGIDVCRRIKETKGNGFKYVIMLTGRDSDDDMVEGLAAGADDYLTKPVQPTILKSRLRAAERIIETVAQNVGGKPEIAGYKLSQQLGEGAFATVWKATQLSTGLPVALKVIRVDLASDQVYYRFEREVQLMQRLDHSGIAQIYDQHVTRDLAYSAIELIDGTTFDNYLHDQKPNPIDILNVIAKVCDILEYAHQQGVVHRDVKPSNIMITRDKQPKLLDLGLGKSLFHEQQFELEQNLSLDGSAIGTPTFMAPEQACGEHDKIDGRTDVYALGIVLYIALVRRHPHNVQGQSVGRTLLTMATKRAQRPCEFDPQFDLALQDVMMKALARRPDDRYPSAGEFSRAIREFLHCRSTA